MEEEQSDDDGDISFCSVKEIIEADTQQQTIKSLIDQVSILSKRLEQPTTSAIRNYDQSIIGSDNQQEVTFKERNYKSSNFKIDKPSSSSNLLTVSQSKNPENASATIDRQQVAFAIEQAQAKVGVAGTSATISPHTPMARKSSDGDATASSWHLVEGRRRRNRRSLLVGNGPDDCVVKGVEKRVALHVSRIHPSTALTDMESMVKAKFPEATVESIQSKHPDIYSSFKVTLLHSNFKSALDVSIWPKNTCINRFLQSRKKTRMVT
nr:unnamed protein product [Callosobruchus analis]